MSAALIHLRDAFQAEGGKEHINFYVGEFSSNTKRLIQVIIWELQYAFVTLMIGLLLWVSQRVYTDQNAYDTLTPLISRNKFSLHLIL